MIFSITIFSFHFTITRLLHVISYDIIIFINLSTKNAKNFPLARIQADSSSKSDSVFMNALLSCAREL